MEQVLDKAKETASTLQDSFSKTHSPRLILKSQHEQKLISLPPKLTRCSYSFLSSPSHLTGILSPFDEFQAQASILIMPFELGSYNFTSSIHTHADFSPASPNCSRNSWRSQASCIWAHNQKQAHHVSLWQPMAWRWSTCSQCWRNPRDFWPVHVWETTDVRRLLRGESIQLVGLIFLFTWHILKTRPQDECSKIFMAMHAILFLGSTSRGNGISSNTPFSRKASKNSCLSLMRRRTWVLTLITLITICSTKSNKAKSRNGLRTCRSWRLLRRRNNLLTLSTSLRSGHGMNFFSVSLTE